jgi:multidrug efflux pump subunit AcrA (membrane-fusion protein)
MKRKRIIGLVVAVVVIGGLLYVGSRAAQQATEAQAPQDGDIVAAFIGDLSASATASGTVVSQREATLSTNVPARVLEVYVREGDIVAADDLLVQLDTTDLALSVAAAQENVRLKEASLAALQEPPTAAELQAAQTAVASAQAQLDTLLAGPTAAELAAYDASLRSSEAALAPPPRVASSNHKFSQRKPRWPQPSYSSKAPATSMRKTPTKRPIRPCCKPIKP